MREIVYIAAPGDEGRLLKRVVRGEMRLSQHQLASVKAEGGLFLDGLPVHANAVVHAGQAIAVRLLDDLEELAAPEDGPVDVVYEDEDMVIVNKPAPLPTVHSPRQDASTLENRMAFHYPHLVFRPVNRLDKGTSGLLALAKHAHAQALLSKQLHTPDFVREYLALVEGVPAPLAGLVDLPIGKADGATVRRCIRPDGKPARTHYETVQVCDNGLAFVRLRLESGRTHQIRVHMAALGCPVLGDFLYGRERPEELPGRFALHSARLECVQPLTGARLSFAAPLPAELARFTNT